MLSAPVAYIRAQCTQSGSEGSGDKVEGSMRDGPDRPLADRRPYLGEGHSSNMDADYGRTGTGDGEAGHWWGSGARVSCRLLPRVPRLYAKQSPTHESTPGCLTERRVSLVDVVFEATHIIVIPQLSVYPSPYSAGCNRVLRGPFLST